ncbi:MAG: PAS domain S-box protein [Deltaproteobacteria bacterium]|nr:PAS domain S-box protein [Deltaproteobacteria bacterium]
MVKNVAHEALQHRIKALEESNKNLAFRNKQLTSLIDNSQMGIVVLDKDMRIVECNEAFERLFLYELDEMKGVLLDDLMADQNHPEEAVSYTTTTLTGKPVQGTGRRRRKDGAFIEVRFNGVPVTVDGEVVGTYGLYEDMTALKAAEKALTETEQAFRALLNAATDPAFLLDPAYRILAVNDAAAKRIGYRPDELIGRHLPDLFSPEIAGIRTANLEKVRKTGKPVRFFESRDNMYFDSHFFPITDENGEVSKIAIFARDITGQHEAEKALKESEEKYRTILESIEEGYYETNLAGDFTFFNASLCRIFGIPENILKDMNYQENTGEEFAKSLYRVFHEVYATGRPDKGAEYEILRDDGTHLYVEVSASLLKDHGGNPIGFRGIIRDIMERKNAERERKRLEAQFHQAQRMEAIGTLAGGIAHDFNNLLMGLQGNTSLMLLDKDPDHPDHDRLKNMEQYIRDAADLTRQLLGFARRGQYVVKSTNLNELMDKSAKMLGRTKKEISIHTKYQEDLWPVAVDQGQIEQVLINLFINAWQAMPGGGDLYLETENVVLDQNDVNALAPVPGRYVKMTVTDTGVGMDQKTLRRIFEPFFTTKGMRRGTGLGLASAYGIVKNHGGFIKAYSELGTGASFTIFLPVGEEEIATRSAQDHDRDEMLRGTETVLLVDDEDTILKIGAELLKKLGYTVILANSGKAAVEMLENTGALIPDLVILDMIMPEMGGGETFDQLKAIDPGLKVLLSSGYSINGQAREILRRGCDGFIQKPFNIYKLSRTLREILDRG